MAVKTKAQATPEIRAAVLEKLHKAGFTDETAEEALGGLENQGGSVEQIIDRILNSPYPDHQAEPEPSPEQSLEGIYALLERVVLLPIPLGTKGPDYGGWQRTTYEDTQRPDYRRNLIDTIARGGNLGVLLGPASGRLLARDVDDDQYVEKLLAVHPWLEKTTRTRGKRGCQFLLRLEEGCEYPNGNAVVNVEHGELRLGGSRGAQSVIFGVHPDGMRYQFVVAASPLEISLADLYELCPSLGTNGTGNNAEPPQPRRAGNAKLEEEDLDEQERPWPVMDEAAYYGRLGKIVKLIEPATGADPVAILAQLLAAIGNIVGRNPSFHVEAVKHHSNLFQCLVGRSSKGRKGTSLNHITRLCAIVDGDWRTERVATGLSSGEGLIWAVRDPIFAPERNKKTGQVDDVKIDNGVDDKRLFVGEAEFAQALRVMSRPANILSTVLRSAYDTGNLRTLTKNSPARATNAHITVVGHITQQELRRELGECEFFNGFANRFLWLVVKRSQFLPEGGELGKKELEEFNRLALELRGIVDISANLTEMKRDDMARALWRDVYPKLSEEVMGLVGAVINRAEAQVLRLSMIYALSDGSAVIQRGHLEAAMAFWDYCRASVYYLFGDRLGNQNAQKILDALKARPEGMTRKQILDEVFQRNVSKEEMGAALNYLAAAKLAHKEQKQTAGRPAEWWFSV